MNDRLASLTPKAKAVLRHLSQHAGRVISQNELLEAVWPHTYIQPEAVKVYIHEIRRVLGDTPNNSRYIQTVSRRGYRLVASLDCDPPEAAPPLESAAPSVFGRERELCRLRECLAAARAGARQVLFVTGEVGIGKTALVDAFTRSLGNDSNVQTLVGRCLKMRGIQEPFYPLLEALSHIWTPCVAESLVAHAPTLAAQFPGLLDPADRDRILRETSIATPGRMLREACDVLDILSRTTVLNLVLDDVQWADVATIDFITAMAHRAGSARISLICTLRAPDVIDPRYPLPAILRELAAKHRCHHMPLTPLDGPAVHALLSQVFGGRPVSDHLAQSVTEYSGGNPLFAHSIAHRLLESQDDQGKIPPFRDLKPEASEDLQSFLHGQFAEMAAEERDLLECGAVAGVSFAGSLLAPLMEIDPATADARCETIAQTSAWLRVKGVEPSGSGMTTRFEFRHMLFHDVIYRKMPRAKRSRLHRRMAEHLEKTLSERAVEHAAELAWRYEECGDLTIASHYLEQAAKQAMRRAAPEKAVSLLRRARALAARLRDAGDPDPLLAAALPPGSAGSALTLAHPFSVTDSASSATAAQRGASKF